MNSESPSAATALGSALSSALICRIGDRLLALPLTAVVETMRPLPVEAFGGTPTFIPGLAMIRGAVVPVVDVRLLLGADQAGESAPERFVTVSTGHRIVALAVDAVLGLRTLDDVALPALPALLDSAGLEVLSAIGTLDAQLLLVLDRARLVPESVWALVPEPATAC